MTSRATSPIAATVGRNIQARRKAAGMTQHDLAVALGTGDAMTVSRWERGYHRPTDARLIVLAAVLGCDVSDFYADELAA